VRPIYGAAPGLSITGSLAFAPCTVPARDRLTPDLRAAYFGRVNLANSLTLSRIVLAPLFFLVYFIPEWTGMFSVLSVVLLWVIFVYMEISDMLDGIVARRWNMVTNLGKVMDPFADVISRLTYFVCFVAVGLMPAWIFIIIMYREFGIVFVRLLMYREGVALAARRGGKLKAALYTLAGVAGILLTTYARVVQLDVGESIVSGIALAMYIGAALLAVVSFTDYLLVFRRRRRELPT